MLSVEALIDQHMEGLCSASCVRAREILYAYALSETLCAVLFILPTLSIVLLIMCLVIVKAQDSPRDKVCASA